MKGLGFRVSDGSDEDETFTTAVSAWNTKAGVWQALEGQLLVM